MKKHSLVRKLLKLIIINLILLLIFLPINFYLDSGDEFYLILLIPSCLVAIYAIVFMTLSESKEVI